MDFQINSRDPVYLQVVRYFKLQIAKGFLSEGQEIPSRREMASILKINPNTVQKAYKEMEDQELIITVRNFPSTVTDNSEILQNVKSELIADAVKEFVDSIFEIGLPVDEVVKVVRTQYEKQLKKQKEDFS